MIETIDAIKRLDDSYLEKGFDLKRWQVYMEGVIKGSAKTIIDDSAQYDFDRDCRPIIDNALKRRDLRHLISLLFKEVSVGLDDKIKNCFGKSVDACIVAYLGLCNGAGWATELNGRQFVLLGVEKIIELNWLDVADMYGLIFHELGHIYQAQYGVLDRTFTNEKDQMIWQLFTEGIAMYFEQRLVGNMDFYHQDKDDWKDFMIEHEALLKKDFMADINKEVIPKRYFGDWCDYCGYGDAGYYLGAKFIQWACRQLPFEKLIKADIEDVSGLLEIYMA